MFLHVLLVVADMNALGMKLGLEVKALALCFVSQGSLFIAGTSGDMTILPLITMC